MQTLKRIPTITVAFWRLLSMSREEVDDFLTSYDFFGNDFMSEEHMRSVLGKDYIDIYRNSVRNRYHVMNFLCALGDVEKMYSPPLIDETKSPFDNQLMFEERMVEEMKPVLTPNGRILDLGSGRGTVSANVYEQTGNGVLGINIDPTQIEVGRKMAMKKRYPIEFILGDFNEPETFGHLEERSFDAAYQIQALSNVHDKPRFFRSVNRCLRVGGRYVILAYCRNSHYDRDNPIHYDLMVRTKQLMAAIYSPLASELLEWLEDSGFRVVHSEDLSIKGDLSWLVLYEKLSKHFNRIHTWVSRLSRYRALPRGMAEMLTRFTSNGDAWYEADRLRLVAPAWYIIADKVRDVGQSTSGEY